MTGTMSFNDRLCSALVTAKNRAPEIVALLHSAFHDGHYLPVGYVSSRLTEARTEAEEILVAIILAAEQALAPRPAPVPANDISPDTTYDAEIAAVDQIMREGAAL